MDGPSPGQGRLEVLINGQWGTVCSDGFGEQDAKVACRSMGRPAMFALAYKASEQQLARDPGLPILLDDLECEGTEESLLECGHAGVGRSNCGHAKDVHLACPFTDLSEELTPAAEGGSTSPAVAAPPSPQQAAAARSPPPPGSPPPAPTASEPSIRLVDGPTGNTGRLEVFVDGQWG